MIVGKRIRNAQKHLLMCGLKTWKVQLYCPINLVTKQSMEKAGIENIQIGDAILPTDSWPISSFNANWKYIKQRQLPKETCYRQAIWHWTDYTGKEHEKLVDIPYKRYPREFIAPPWVELVRTIKNNQEIFVSKTLINVADEKEVLHAINLFLELFGMVYFVNEVGTFLNLTNVRQVNWSILPKWKSSLDHIIDSLHDFLEKKSKDSQSIIYDRIKHINKFSPDFVAIWEGGFYWYLVFGFDTAHKYILESCIVNNATYVLNDDWETISKLSKAEILSSNLHEDRIIHTLDWYGKVQKYLA